MGKIGVDLRINWRIIALIGNGEKKVTSHLNALQLRLSNERIRLANARNEAERKLRIVWIAQIEKEISAEPKGETEMEMSDTELLAALTE